MDILAYLSTGLANSGVLRSTRQVDHPLIVLHWSSCRQTHIIYKRFQIDAYDLQVKYSEMNDSFNGVLLKHIATGV